jgi:hypothetical protein
MAASTPAQAAPAPTLRPVGQRVAQPGDRICSNCREPNDPSRKFCRRCGTSLATAQVHSAKPPSWWRRTFQRQSTAATPKPGGSGEGGTALRSILKGGLVALIALAIVAVVAVPSIRGAVLSTGGAILNDIRRLVAPELIPVFATNATASSEIEEHPAQRAIDRFKNTDWQAAEATPSINLAFDAPFDLAAVWIHNGTAENYTAFRRPKKLAFVFPDGSRTEIELVDNHDPQRLEISANGIRALEIRVVEATGPEGAPVALSEIEFIGKR